MNTPEEFKRFVRSFWQGSEDEAASVREWIANALSLSDHRQKAVIANFLDDVLRRDVSGKELQRIWSSGGPSYMLPDDEDLRAFLRQVRDMIRTQIQP